LYMHTVETQSEFRNVLVMVMEPCCWRAGTEGPAHGLAGRGRHASSLLPATGSLQTGAGLAVTSEHAAR